MWFLRKMPARRPVVTGYHDIEQNIDSSADVGLCLSAVEGFLRLEEEHGVPATYNVVGRLFIEQPRLIERIRAAGQEVAFHSYHHYPDWQPKHYADEVRLCRQLSSAPRGYRSPRSDWNENTLRACTEEGFCWNAESDRADEPYEIAGGLMRLPIADDDWPLHTGQLNPQQWVERFSTLLRRRAYVAFGCHDCVASFKLRERLDAWREVLRRAREEGAVTASFSQAADMWQAGYFRSRASARATSDVP